jgi:hypothetical protein
MDKKEKYLKRFVRLGFVAKGVVHCLLGGIALMTALGITNRQGSKDEAFGMIHEQPFGQLLLMVLGISLLGFVTLRSFQAFNDADHKGKDWKGLVARAGKAGGAIVYLAMSFYAFRFALLGHSDGSTGDLLISKALQTVAGRVVIGIFGASFAWRGGFQIYKGVSGRFMKKMRLQRSGFEKTFRRIGTAGYVSRGVVFLILGYLLFRATFNRSAEESHGTGSAFSFLGNTFGTWLMATVSAGLFLYGIFLFVRARHQDVTLTRKSDGL